MVHHKDQPVIFQGMEVGLRMFRWVVALMLVLFLASGITQVRSEGTGLHLRFGRLLGPPHEPGLVFALPYPVDRIIQVPTRQEGEVEIKEVWKKASATAGQDKIDPTFEGYCLTGDQNIVQARLVAKYRIADPIRFQLWFPDAEALLHDIVLTATTHTIADWRVDDALRLQREREGAPGGVTESLSESVRRRAQERLNALDAGMRLLAVEFKEIHPPRHVVAAFRDVQSAKIETETLQREAEGFRASEVPRAESAMNRMVQEAVAYRNSAGAEASAELAVFKDLYSEYEKNPHLVQQRILMETFEEVIENSGQLRFVAPRTRVIVAD
jgi:membrane protease subunit HflK